VRFAVVCYLVIVAHPMVFSFRSSSSSLINIDPALEPAVHRHTTLIRLVQRSTFPLSLSLSMSFSLTSFAQRAGLSEFPGQPV